MFDIDKNREFKEKVIDNDFNLKFQFTEIVKYISNLEQENTQLKKQLKDKNEKISKVKEYATHTEFEERTAYDTSFCEGVYNVKEKVLKILERNKEN